jgi:thioredoxin reductase (NADPH)
MYDLIVVGGGPTGLTAGLYARTRDLSTVILEAKQFGGQLKFLYPTKSVYDYPSYIAIEAEDLGSLFVNHARESGCQMKEGEEVAEIKRRKKDFLVVTDKGEYEGRAVILALGWGEVTPKTLNVPGEAEFEGKGVYYKIPDRRLFRGKRVVIVGGGDSALESALQLMSTASKITVVHRRDLFRAMEKNVDAVKRSPVEVLVNSEVTEIQGAGRVEQAVVYNNQTLERRIVDADAVIVQVGFVTNLDRVRKWGVELEGDRHIRVQADMSTSIPGVFACGDVVSYPSKDRRIVTGAGEAVTAVLSAYKLLRSPYWA